MNKFKDKILLSIVGLIIIFIFTGISVFHYNNYNKPTLTFQIIYYIMGILYVLLIIIKNYKNYGQGKNYKNYGQYELNETEQLL